MASKKSLLSWARKHDMSIYTKNAGPTIMGLMSKAAEVEEKRVSVEQEIDLVRATLIRTVEHWNLTLEVLKPTEAEPLKGEEMRLTAERLVRDAAEQVSKLVQAQAKVRMLDMGALQMTSVSWVVAEVCRAIEETVQERAPTVADELINRIRKIKLPEDETLSQFVKAQSDEKFL